MAVLPMASSSGNPSSPRAPPSITTLPMSPSSSSLAGNQNEESAGINNPKLVQHSWASGNRRVEKGFQLEHQALFSGATEIEFDEEEWAEGVEEWENSLVGFVFGIKLPYFRMKAFVEYKWGGASMVTVSELDKGVFLFKFKEKAGLEKIISQGPWSFDNKPFVLRPWSPDMSLDFSDITKVPVWVKLPGLNFHLWQPKPLSKIASIIGKPICTDGFTASHSRLQYARVCVEIDSSHDLVHEVLIRAPKGVSIKQKIEYEWVPSRCSKCMVFGHSTSKCAKKTTQKWVDKSKGVELENEEIPDFVRDVSSVEGSKDEDIMAPKIVESIVTNQDQQVVTKQVDSLIQEENPVQVSSNNAFSCEVQTGVDSERFIPASTKKKSRKNKASRAEPILLRSKGPIVQAANSFIVPNG